MMKVLYISHGAKLYGASKTLLEFVADRYRFDKYFGGKCRGSSGIYTDKIVRIYRKVVLN